MRCGAGVGGGSTWELKFFAWVAKLQGDGWLSCREMVG